jgi:hypothetical protein
VEGSLDAAVTRRVGVDVTDIMRGSVECQPRSTVDEPSPRLRANDDAHVTPFQLGD